jgi:hypothetical protein
MNANRGVLLATVLVLLLATPAGGARPYELTAEGSVDTPIETVRLVDATAHVSSTVALRAGDPIRATVVAPAGETIRLDLVDAAETRLATRDAAAGTVSVPTESLRSGTYYLVLRQDGTVHATQRVVLSRHDVGLSIEPTPATEVPVRVTVIPGGDVPYESVEVVATDGTYQTVATASTVRLGLYDASVNRSELSPGEYAVFARLVGESGEYVGMSDVVGLSVPAAGDARQPTATSAPASAVTPASVGTGAEPEPATGDGADGERGGAPSEGELPETGAVLLLAALVAAGVLYRLRR